MEALIMILGNRKVLLFDTNKIKALQHKYQTKAVFDVAPVLKANTYQEGYQA